MPINKAVSIVNMYACKKATRHSNTSINNVNGTDTKLVNIDFEIKINEIKLITII
jgi:hypothetical protein